MTLACTLVSACQPDGGDGDTSTGTSAAETGAQVTDSVTGPGDDAGEPTGSATHTGTTQTGGSETGSETGSTATEATATESTATEATAGDDTGFMPPAGCLATDPLVSAAFALDLTAWPVESFVAACTVEGVQDEGGTVRTTLACELDGAPLPTTLDIPTAPEGAVAWAAGDLVQLHSVVGGGEGSKLRHVQLRAADDGLLVSAEVSELADAIEARFEPLGVHLVAACTDRDLSEGSPMRVDFTPPGGPVVSVFHGHRGVVPISADELFAIDVETALGGFIHPDEDVEIVVRRVKTGA